MVASVWGVVLRMPIRSTARALSNKTALAPQRLKKLRARSTPHFTGMGSLMVFGSAFAILRLILSTGVSSIRAYPIHMKTILHPQLLKLLSS